MSTLLLFVEEIRAAVENITVFLVHFYDEISILAFGTAANIVLMHLIIGHKITNFRFVGADPKVQTVILVKLIL